MRDYSRLMAEIATKQEALFCKIKSNILDYLQSADQNPAESMLFDVLVYNRVRDLYDDLKKTIDNQKNNPEARRMRPCVAGVRNQIRYLAPLDFVSRPFPVRIHCQGRARVRCVAAEYSVNPCSCSLVRTLPRVPVEPVWL
jgi:hypothetical protein